MKALVSGGRDQGLKRPSGERVGGATRQRLIRESSVRSAEETLLLPDRSTERGPPRRGAATLPLFERGDGYRKADAEKEDESEQTHHQRPRKGPTWNIGRSSQLKYGASFMEYHMPRSDRSEAWRQECETINQEMDGLILSDWPRSKEENQVRKMRFMALVERRSEAARHFLSDAAVRRNANWV